MGWIAAQFRTRQRWGWSLAGVLVSVLVVHLWLLRQTWDGGLALPEADDTSVVQGHIVMQRLAQAVQPAPTTAAASASIPKPNSTVVAAAQTGPVSIDAPPTEQKPATESAPDTPAANQPPAESVLPNTPAAPILQTQHLQAVSTLWRYQVTAESKGRNFFANATLQWKLEQDRYSAHAVVSALLLGQRTQTSVGRLGAQGLMPERFTDVSRRTREVLLDWTQRTAQRDGQTVASDLPDGTQDRLSAIVQLTVQLMNAPTQPTVGQEWAMPVMGFSELEHWTFVYLGQAMQELPAGQFITWHLQRKPAPDDKRGVTVDLWLAPAQYFVPVRIRYTEANGDFVDQKLSAL